MKSFSLRLDNSQNPAKKKYVLISENLFSQSLSTKFYASKAQNQIGHGQIFFQRSFISLLLISFSIGA